MNHLVWLALLITPLSTLAQQLGGELRLSPRAQNGTAWHQGTFYVGTFLNQRTLLHLELGVGYFVDTYETTSGGQPYQARYVAGSPTFGLGVDHTVFTFPKQRISVNFGIMAMLPRQIATRVDLTKYRLWGTDVGFRLGLNAGYARRFVEYYFEKRWQQISYPSVGIFYQII